MSILTEDPSQNATVAGASAANAVEPIATISTGSSFAVLQREVATPTKTAQRASATATTTLAVEVCESGRAKWRLMTALLQGIGSNRTEKDCGG